MLTNLQALDIIEKIAATRFDSAFVRSMAIMNEISKLNLKLSFIEKARIHNAIERNLKYFEK